MNRFPSENTISIPWKFPSIEQSLIELFIEFSNTIPRFYGAEEFAEIIGQAGFEDVNFTQLLFGVAAIHEGTKQS